jgi:hypothetical protein
MDDIRMLEDQVKQELDAKIDELGMVTSDEMKNAGSIKSTPY